MTSANPLAGKSEQVGPVRALMATKDWSATPLGATEKWPASLNTVLRLMLNSRYSMWMGWGPELFFFCNDAYREKTLGEKYKWAIGRPFREVWAEIWDVLQPRIDHVLSTGEATWDEGLLLFLERNGYPEETYHTFSYSAAPGDDPNQVGGLFCTVFEETERVIGERRIALLGAFASLLANTNTSQELYTAVESCLVNEARDIPFSLTYLFNDDATAVRVACTGFAEGHPAAPTEILDDSVWSLSAIWNHPTPRVIDLPADTKWPTGPWKLAPTKALIVPIARQGHDRPAGVFVAGLNPHRPLEDSEQNFVQLFVGQLAAGLSNAMAFEEAKRRADALTELDRAKTAFFSNVSHEFRTPLTLMLAPIEDMRGAPSISVEEKERLDLLHRNALRLLKLVNTLLDFSRIEAGRVEAVYEETDLPTLTTDLASNFRSAIERAGLRLVVECPPFEEPIFVDRLMWEKIVLNLLSNAFKFTFDGTISVRLRLTADDAVLEVSDTGIGVAEHELPRLFERFHRIEGARSRSHEGSGIGLALVNDLVHMQGGSVEVKSRVGEGTSFFVRIPRGQKHLPQGRVQPSTPPQKSSTVGANAYVEEALRWVGPSSSELSLPDANTAAKTVGDRPRLVVADDNADMLDYITRLLRERWDVEPVGDGKAALEAIRRQPPDLVLSDVMMPELDGFGLLEVMRADPELRRIPVVLLSARAGEEATEEGLKAGADDYIVKPFTARDLLVRITARLAAAKAAQDALAQRENLYRHFMQAPFPIAIFRERNQIIELVNAACLKAWGKTEVVVGLPLVEAVPELHGQPFIGLLEKVYLTGVAHEETEIVARLATGPDGSLQDNYYSFVYAPLFDSNGGVEGVIICAFDVTAAVLARKTSDKITREASAALEQSLQAAEQTNRAKDEFLATMSHELRTPLNAMLGWATLLKADSSDRTKLQRGLDAIERNAQAQARLVSDLLDVSRIISGKLSLTLKKIPLSTAIYAAVDVVRPAAEAKGVRLVIDLDPDVGSIVADPDRLQQIVWNLLSNAVRFTPTKGRVTVTAHRVQSEVVISVQDTGAGIAAEHLPHIFDRFRQVDSSITRAHGGLGLGLSIVRHLVDAHGGTVAAHSDGTGAGATFTVSLPIRAVVPPEVALPDLETPPTTSIHGAYARHDLQGARILVVDDEVDSLELLRIVLEAAGATVVTAASAEEALGAAGDFDVIVSDIGMPEVDGYAFMRQFQARERKQQIPAIALTAYARVEDAERALRAGYRQHLAKPVDPSKLVETIRDSLHPESQDPV